MNTAPRTVADDSVPRLPRGVRLVDSPAQGGIVLLGAGAGVQARRHRHRDPQALRRHGDGCRNCRRACRDLQRAARARARRRQGAARLARRQAAAGTLIMAAGNGQALHKPLGLLAELTHRCPLGCPYCSNPLDARPPLRRARHRKPGRRVFREAAALGVLQVHISGGEPAARRDIVELVSGRARGPALHQPDHLRRRREQRDSSPRSAEAGLDHVQISIQDSQPASADHIAGYRRRLCAQERARRRGGEAQAAAHHQHGGASRQYRPHRGDGRAGAWRSAPAASRSRMCSITAGR